ncbi:predicted protein [Sclerotinia sclerotiorum 1980 UF-70]|uniref:Uncharacterized protein n=1 Tax=Sclerotinia sclerotiorum (strain ATCC 18683 / 1980 / Ss-1) TaxID=665079 RepID=A7F2A3_SCLS1|nr:predicted protein [Sclerotinia sclerotiorum 1980 UF-70]EDN95845.1 predicted protein [Sclerotinia sclerotiorum 1980 UF-70]
MDRKDIKVVGRRSRKSQRHNLSKLKRCQKTSKKEWCTKERCMEGSTLPEPQDLASIKHPNDDESQISPDLATGNNANKIPALVHTLYYSQVVMI